MSKENEQIETPLSERSSGAANVRQLTMPYECWRFLYWLKNGQLTYPEIDRKVNSGELIPDNSVIA